ncbi:alpha-E domain-containing protein [Marinobacterium sedimentorum]|uniref:alpha-E domain-containing protein n=1 Tax=Marinobacterium sedimentorum TaxID=2927804 RepID=UPI0020C6D885|nr:alpha-E domain-containing protein [Marinobacterium sedimentorum]MCP8690292.1 alpha-E domain-containing protein [Marinobacterium sedimentorum]
MMLSRVAERIYWAARYLERVENTARLVSVYDNLLFDLPRSVNIGWFNLVIINSGTELFFERYKVQDERNVVKFTLADDTNPSSMLSSLTMLRENIRTARDVLPAEAWELVNELLLFARNDIQQGINRNGRHAFLNGIIEGCQGINGLLLGTMSRDAAWHFMRLGCNLERADMTTRLLDAGAAVLQLSEDNDTTNLPQIVWGNVLRSGSAYMAYRRTMRTAVNGTDVAHFLLGDEHFPRSVSFCLDQISSATARLPSAGKRYSSIKPQLPKHDIRDGYCMSPDFRDYLNDQQLVLAEAHNNIASNWFAHD